MKVLVTGASGFLGSWFLNHYIKVGGHDVWMVDTRPHPAGIPIDQMDMVDWLAIFDEDVDIAFHLAAPSGSRVRNAAEPLAYADALRLDGAFFLWAVRHAKLAVYASGAEIYPLTLQRERENYPLHEGFISPQNPNWSAPDGMIGLSKLMGEYMAWEAAQKYGLNVLAIRPFTGYGPGQSTDHPVASIMAQAVEQANPLRVWGAGSETRDLIYVTDIVDATIARINAGVRGYEVMNLASGHGVTLESVAKDVATIAGYQPDIAPDPSKPLGGMGQRGDASRMERYHRPTVGLLQGLRWTYEAMRSPEVVERQMVFSVESAEAVERG